MRPRSTTRTRRDALWYVRRMSSSSTLRLSCAAGLFVYTGCASAPPGSAGAPVAAASGTGAPAAGSAASVQAPPEAPTASAQPAASTPPGSTESAKEPFIVSTSKAHTDGKHYALDAKAPSAVKVGASGEVEIALEAKDGYHVNDKYPYKLVPAAEPADLLSFEKKELVRADATMSKGEAKFKVKFAALKSGTAKVGGLLAFSVCTAKECVVDKVELTVPVTIR
jgi:hypothetical protein